MLPPSTAGLAWCKALGQKKKKPQFPSCSFVFSDKQSRLKYPFALFTVSLSSHSGFILCQLALLIDYLLGRRSNLSARILIHVEKKPHAFDNGVERETVPFFFSSPVSKVMRFLTKGFSSPSALSSCRYVTLENSPAITPELLRIFQNMSALLGESSRDLFVIF